jgi:uncharacterized protein YutE (UPF0331/DUF86 family)
MDRQVIEQKLESLRRCVQRVSDKCPPDAQSLARDADLQDIIALNLSRAVQLCVDIGAHLVAHLETTAPETMGEIFETLAHSNAISEDLAARLKKAVGFRNIAVHNYEQIDWAIVHSIARHHLVDFTDFARSVASRLL